MSFSVMSKKTTRGASSGVNLEGEPASRFPLPTGTGKTRSPCLPFSGGVSHPALRPRGRLPLGSLYERLPVEATGHLIAAREKKKEELPRKITPLRDCLPKRSLV